MKRTKKSIIQQILHISTIQQDQLYNLNIIRKRHGQRWIDGYPVREPTYDKYGKPKVHEDPLEARTRRERKLQATFTRINTYNENMRYENWGSWLTWPNKKGKKAPRPNSIKAQMDRMAKIDDKPVDNYDINEHKAPYENLNNLENENELGKNSSPPLRILGSEMDKLDKKTDFENLKFKINFDPKSERLPSLGLGRAYDTGLRFDRSRPFLRFDRYPDQFHRKEIKPRMFADGSYDTRPFLESDIEALPLQQNEDMYNQRRNAWHSARDPRPIGSEYYYSKLPRHPHVPNPLPPSSDTKIPTDDIKPEFDQNPNNRLEFTPLGASYRLPRDGPNFRHMSTWKEVADTIREMEPDKADPQFFSQAFHSLKGMEVHPPAEFLIELADICIEQAHRMLPISLSNVIHACAKMRFVYTPLIETWIRHLNDEKMLEACTDMDITCICYSFGQINRQMKRQIHRKMDITINQDGKHFVIPKDFINKLGYESMHPMRVQSYTRSMLINVFNGLCLLKIENEDIIENFINLLLQPESMSQLTQQNLTTILYSIAYIRYTKNMKAVEMLIREIMKRISSLSSQGVSSTLWSIGNLKFKDKILIKEFSKLATSETRLRMYTEQDLTNILYGLSMSKIKDPEIIGAIAQEYKRPGRVSELHELGISNLLFSFSQLGFYDEALITTVVRELTNPSRIKVLSNQTISTSMYGLGTSRFRYLDALNPLLEEIVDPDRLSLFSENDLSNIIYGIGHMRIRNQEILKKLFKEVEKERRINLYATQALVNILYTCAQVGYCDEDLIVVIGRELIKERRIKQLDEIGMALSVGALTRIQLFDPVIFKAYLDHIVIPSRLISAKGTALTDILYGCYRAEVSDFAKFNKIALSFMEPGRIQALMNFPFARLVMVCSFLGIRDDSLLKTFRDEVLREGRRQSFGHQERKDFAQAFERLTYFDDELCQFLGYGQRVKGVRTGILAPGALKDLKEFEISKDKDESVLDWAGLPSADVTTYQNLF